MQLQNKEAFFQHIIDAIPEHIAVINKQGEIIFVNQKWRGSQHCIEKNDDDLWLGQNYIEVCKKAAEAGDTYAKLAVKGILRVVAEQQQQFYFEYPCAHEEVTQWFMMRIGPLDMGEKTYYVITHQDITERRLAEDKIACLARQDGLTKLANRHAFDEFVLREWRRCMRAKLPITLALIDLDFFKQLNDNYGHAAGDEALKKTALVLKKFVNRAGDLASRYGGEEFVLIWSETHACHGILLAKLICKEIERLKITNTGSLISDFLTASIGIASCIPDPTLNCEELLQAADKNLYIAKGHGRNRVHPS
ncbi:sensor domain-containing diguanylate cyclase [Gayadomonas joobiniege]|uniref:sensor domain-containing diguanylate cyclase n=1 Tax=Gayadomonas joobiniege TaxID=1234606 RepID=UPI0003642243|nr:sensor domain-containing diguanylate cyclase [Gayadomonas joobiniege]